ncbi:MAG: molybdenum cofactor guanylyltransferase [Gammaproteobacteria bacterium]|nr:molybdenum cofactor guanylyltransferase [Gammaproteobacteria bacterium]MBU1625011.1 molybdenum cofactor guanylyltransferase [Gammaproteobacteria bacterium]MBU1981271.1 molybdenum cofactor guanylyltransferase [Gammaproteobacteria bacterium]
MITDCTALILAGGDSSRMGQDKAGLLLEGTTLLQRVTATMQGVFPKVIVSVRQPRAEVALHQVCDAEADGGPLAGLVAGLAQVETPWMFAVACDMPFIQSAVITRMAELRGEQHAVVPMIDGHPQPLFAFYAKQALPMMRETLASGEKRVRAVLKQLDVRYVSEAELREYDPQFRSFIDLDTPQDHTAAQELK